MFLISAGFLLVYPSLFRLEIFAINIALIPAVILIAVQLLNRITVPNFRWVAASLLALPMFLMSQTLPVDTLQQKKYRTLSLGAQGGSFKSQVVNDTDPKSCGSASWSRDFENTYIQ
ncbi:MAG: hypothetical protein U5K79_25300, partial [Cyclobacteriaceae bacterium]|nr:hypothetical protein [Cyclobacteriaceae bacterium]